MFAAAIPSGTVHVKSIGPNGELELKPSQLHWDLYSIVQQSIQDSVTTGSQADSEHSQQRQPSRRDGRNPQIVLDKLRQAKGELDVIVDLVTAIEQQQFVGVAHADNPPTEAERLRAAALRLATRSAQLAAAEARLRAGTQALRIQADIDNRFLCDLRFLRDRWTLRRHPGTDAMFYADLSLPLYGPAAQGLSQEGAHVNIIQDTNGDACMVESAPAAAAPGESDGRGRTARVLRGWRAIDAALERRQQLLTWTLVRQMLARDSRLPQHERDADGAVEVLLRLADEAVATTQATLRAAAAGPSSAMDVDDAPDQAFHRAAASIGDGGDAAQQHAGAAWGMAQASSMQSAAAHDIEALFRVASTQPQFEARALRLLAGLLGQRTSSGWGAREPNAAKLLSGLLRWLRHAALCYRVGASLRRQATAASNQAAVQQLQTGEVTAVWHVRCGGREALVVVQDGVVRLEGAGAWDSNVTMAPSAELRHLSRAELDFLLLSSHGWSA